MRVMFDVSYVQKRMTGIGRASLELLRALVACDRANNYAMHGWSLSLDKELLQGLPSKCTESSLRRVPGFAKRWYWNHLDNPRIEALLGEFEVFHSADPILPPTARRTVATVHDLAYRLHPEWFTAGAREWHENNRRSLERASAIIVPSKATLDDLGNVFPDLVQKVHVVHWPIGRQFCPSSPGYDDNRAVARYALPDRYALFVGTIEPRKNLSRLLDAFEKVPELRSADLTLVIAGKIGWKSKDTVRRIHELQARGIVRQIGHVADADLPAIYRRARLFVYPSLFEGFGYPVFEAMACGTPVVAGVTTCLNELAGGAALLVNPASIGSLAEAVLHVSTDEGRRSAMSRRGIDLASRFSPEAAARETQRIYAEIA